MATMFPRRVFTAEDMSKTLVELELAPSASIVILPVSRPVPLWDSRFPVGPASLAWSGLNELDFHASPLSSRAGRVVQWCRRLAVASGRSWARCSTLCWPCGGFSAPWYLQARPLGKQLQEVKASPSPTRTPAQVLTKPRGETFCCQGSVVGSVHAKDCL